MAYVYKTETHDESGLSFRIVLDDMGCVESPLDNDESVAFFVFHRKFENPSESLARDPDALAEWEADNVGIWKSFPLFLYDHSAQCYRPSRSGNNPFSCPWDSGRVGSIALKHADFGAGADLFKIAESICDAYTSWANGEIYGFEILDFSGEVMDSCWGFIGNPDESGIIEEARDALQSAVKEASKNE